VGWSGASAGEKIAAVGQTAVAAAKIAAPAYGAVKGAEYLATHSAMKSIEAAQEERKKRREQGQP